MPLFKNPTDRVLRFEFAGERFVLQPGDCCEIAKRLEGLIASRGLQVIRVPYEEAKAVVEPTTAEAVRPVEFKGVEVLAPAEPDPVDDGDGEDDVATVAAVKRAAKAIRKNGSH